MPDRHYQKRPDRRIRNIKMGLAIMNGRRLIDVSRDFDIVNTGVVHGIRLILQEITRSHPEASNHAAAASTSTNHLYADRSFWRPHFERLLEATPSVEKEQTA